MNETLNVHHIIPRRLGGRDVMNNLVSLCADKCHELLELSPPIRRAKRTRMVRIDADIRTELMELGMKNESYSDVIRRLIRFYQTSK
jgi:hypothetical protein